MAKDYISGIAITGAAACFDGTTNTPSTDAI